MYANASLVFRWTRLAAGTGSAKSGHSFPPPSRPAPFAVHINHRTGSLGEEDKTSEARGEIVHLRRRRKPAGGDGYERQREAALRAAAGAALRGHALPWRALPRRRGRRREGRRRKGQRRQERWRGNSWDSRAQRRGRTTCSRRMEGLRRRRRTRGRDARLVMFGGSRWIWVQLVCR
jgi:hypothetical protein